MQEMVIFKECGVYKMTSLENYEAKIRNEFKVCTFSDCNSFAECVACVPNADDTTFYDRTGDI